MRYSASDKTEIIRLVEQSHLPARRTLEKLGIPRSSFYRWYDRHQRGGPEALADRPSRPDRVWNRIPEAIRSQIVDLALDQPELSPRELAVRFTDEAEYFVSEASVYRLLKAHDLIAGPAYIVIKAAEEFRDKTTAPNQLWQTDFTYLKITGWGWCYLSTVLDDFSRFIVAWKLCATMKALKHAAIFASHKWFDLSRRKRLAFNSMDAARPTTVADVPPLVLKWRPSQSDRRDGPMASTAHPG